MSSYASTSGDPAAEFSSTPLYRVHAALRGRYKWAILLGLLLAAGGGMAGWLVRAPVYRSVGTLSIAPVLPHVLTKTEQTELLPMFEAYVDRQVAQIQSQRIVAMAMKDPAWKNLGRGATPEEMADFYDQLEVVHPRRSELIHIAFLDEQKRVTSVAVKALILAYLEVYGNIDIESLNQRLKQLELLRSDQRRQLTGLEESRRAIASEFGTDDLTGVYQAKLQDVAKWEGLLQQIRFELAAGKARERGGEVPEPGEVAPEGPVQPDPTPPSSELTAPQIAELDRSGQMQAYLQQRLTLEAELASLRLTVGENHKALIRMKALLADTNKVIEEYAAEYNQRYAAGQITSTPTGTRSLAELKERERLAMAAFTKAKRELVELGAKNLRIASLASQEEALRGQLQRTESRLRDLTTEQSISGRIKVISDGEVPLKPFKDPRKLLAVFGATSSAAVGVGIIALMGLADRRIRNLHDAQDSFGSESILGVLPKLPSDLSDPVQSVQASHCVHQIRTLLQIGADSQGRRVLAITSPAKQEGKTSLSLALGLSFSTAGAKTLLIDSDLMTGGVLTRRVNSIIRHKIGRILEREGLVSLDQIEQAIDLARREDKRLGEALVELGYLGQEDLDQALLLQDRMPVGLLDALDGEPLEDCVAPTGFDGLDILPVGGADARDSSRMSPSSFRQLLNEARKHYDMVLVDTGVTPDSIEASHAAVEADGVVFVLSSGEQRGRAERSIDYLDSIGARVAGIVFNKADTGAIVDADSAFSGGVPDLPDLPKPGESNPSRSRRLGPVAGAVASAASSSSDSEHHSRP
ncbi:MAG: hypothetical protein OER86_04125 [Phycisphaerae bacterium]|nr:hypothetical protein [Phycisphaerae bacterium]